MIYIVVVKEKSKVKPIHFYFTSIAKAKKFATQYREKRKGLFSSVSVVRRNEGSKYDPHKYSNKK